MTQAEKIKSLEKRVKKMEQMVDSYEQIVSKLFINTGLDLDGFTRTLITHSDDHSQAEDQLMKGRFLKKVLSCQSIGQFFDSIRNED